MNTYNIIGIDIRNDGTMYVVSNYINCEIPKDVNLEQFIRNAININKQCEYAKSKGIEITLPKQKGE